MRPIRIAILCAMSFFAISHSIAQNLPYADDRPIHLGFSLGLNSLNFTVTPSNQLIDGKVYYPQVSNLQTGFSVGIVSDLKLNQSFNLRFTPSLIFGERIISYLAWTDPMSNKADRSVTSIPVCLPIMLKFSSERRGNYRPYLIWGGGAYFDLGRNTTNTLLLNTFDIYTEFGAGCDLYFSFFKFAPELKFCIGLNDVFMPLDKRDSGAILESEKKYSMAISRLTSRFLTLTFNFE